MYVRLMRKTDTEQVSLIDREAFPTDWPPTNFSRELENRLAFYIVVTEKPPRPDRVGEAPSTKHQTSRPLFPTPGPTSPPAPRVTEPEGVWARIRGWFSSQTEPRAEPEERILGYAGMWVLADEAHVMSIASRRAYRRHGIGEALVIGLIDLAHRHKARVVTLEVRQSNTAAQSLYAKFGFNNVGVRKGYYLDNREDAIIMTTEFIGSAAFKERMSLLKEEHARQWGETRFDLERPEGRLS